MHKTLPTWKWIKNNSKLNFTKIYQASWFSHRWLKISKWSISLTWLGKCSKSKVTSLIYVHTQKYTGNRFSKLSRLSKLMYLSLNSEVYLKQTFNIDFQNQKGIPCTTEEHGKCCWTSYTHLCSHPNLWVCYEV